MRLESRSGSVDRPSPTSPKQLRTTALPGCGAFFRFIAANPELRCDFVSLHRKGTVGNDPPDPRRLDAAAADTASRPSQSTRSDSRG